jgi:hypothetical protein
VSDERGRVIEEFGMVHSAALGCARLIYRCRIPDLGYIFRTTAADLESARARRDRDLVSKGISTIQFQTEEHGLR